MPDAVELVFDNDYRLAVQQRLASAFQYVELKALGVDLDVTDAFELEVVEPAEGDQAGLGCIDMRGPGVGFVISERNGAVFVAQRDRDDIQAVACDVAVEAGSHLRHRLEGDDAAELLHEVLAPHADVRADVDRQFPIRDERQRTIELPRLIHAPRVHQVIGQVRFAIGEINAGDLFHFQRD